MRKHKIKNIVQHYEMLLQYKGDAAAYYNYIDWFMTLPLFYENDDFRVVHACCLDYSVAKGYKLVAYRWDGSQILDPAILVWVDACT